MLIKFYATKKLSLYTEDVWKERESHPFSLPNFYFTVFYGRTVTYNLVHNFLDKNPILLIFNTNSKLLYYKSNILMKFWKLWSVAPLETNRRTKLDPIWIIPESSLIWIFRQNTCCLCLWNPNRSITNIRYIGGTFPLPTTHCIASCQKMAIFSVKLLRF